jgi:hypothetical protein
MVNQRGRAKTMLATWNDAFREFAWNYGMDHPDRAWLLHDNDVWLANPHYVGPPVPHPEDYDFEDEAPAPDAPAPEVDDDLPF